MSAQIKTWRQLAQFVASSDAALAKVLQTKHGIGLTEFLALDFLVSSANEELRMQDLSGRLHLNQSSVTRLVERLERQGLTKRDVCPDDKRGIYTVLTETGKRKVEDARPDYEGYSLQAMNSISVQGTIREMIV